ncbi:MAG: hypothetical protein F6K30_27485 [Cyanothece sp. SIO2G6]|nr:hypothetical protein [Cyanothece sp. SIO2G6]
MSDKNFKKNIFINPPGLHRANFLEVFWYFLGVFVAVAELFKTIRKIYVFQLFTFLTALSILFFLLVLFLCFDHILNIFFNSIEIDVCNGEIKITRNAKLLNKIYIKRTSTIKEIDVVKTYESRGRCIAISDIRENVSIFYFGHGLKKEKQIEIVHYLKSACDGHMPYK